MHGADFGSMRPDLQPSEIQRSAITSMLQQPDAVRRTACPGKQRQFLRILFGTCRQRVRTGNVLLSFVPLRQEAHLQSIHYHDIHLGGIAVRQQDFRREALLRRHHGGRHDRMHLRIDCRHGCQMDVRQIHRPQKNPRHLKRRRETKFLDGCDYNSGTVSSICIEWEPLIRIVYPASLISER